MTQRDCYEVLGVDRSADADTIKKAYRKMAMQFHPDKNPGDKAAEEKFKEAASAYEILSNPEKRAQYDRFGHAAFQNGGGRRGGPGGFQDVEDIFSSFGDIFGDLFGQSGPRGGGSRRSRTSPRRGADLRYVTEVTLKEVIEGVEKQIEFKVEDSCETCSGSGSAAGSKPVTCSTCGGAGQVRVSQGFFQMATTCPTCHGEGSQIKDPCKKCKGKGRVPKERKIKVTIPAGVDTGTRLRVSGEGESGHLGGGPGDLYVEISVKEDSRFEREGDHLHSALEVDYLQLLLGGEVDVPTVTGQKKLKVPAGTAVDSRLKLVGEGLPSLRGSRRGDIHFHVRVKFPNKLTKNEEKLLKEIAKDRGISVGDGDFSFFGKKG